MLKKPFISLNLAMAVSTHVTKTLSSNRPPKMRLEVVQVQGQATADVDQDLFLRKPGEFGIVRRGLPANFLLRRVIDSCGA